MITTIRLSTVALDTAVSDPADRNMIAMSTLIASDAWLLETSWDGACIGDVQVFHNANVNGAGNRIQDGDKWVFWGGIPCARVKSYRVADPKQVRPATLDRNAERKAKPGDSPARGQAPIAAPVST